MGELPQKYFVIYHAKSKRNIEKFSDEEEALLRKAELEKKHKRIAFVENGIIHPINEEMEHKKNELWCPYEGAWRKFVTDPVRKIPVCSYCGISDSDYYVRKENDLFGKVK